jgi:ion channel
MAYAFPASVVIAAAGAADAPAVKEIIEEGIGRIETLPLRIEQAPVVQHFASVIPAADVVLGGSTLIVIMLVHAAGVRFVTNHAVRRSHRIMLRPTTWRADLLMSDTVFMLLALHLAEIFVWAAALVYAGLVPDWRTAGFFAGNTYTTVGYGKFVLPPKWEMVAPIIAMSGLFSFGWSGSILVELVRRCQRIKDAANKARRDKRPMRPLPKDSEWAKLRRPPKDR